MIGIILAAGKGSRIQQLNYPSKCLIDINGLTLLEHNLEYLNRANITLAYIVVGHNKDSIITKLGNNYKGISIQYIVQEELNGIVGALKIAKNTIPYDDFIMLLGDELYTQLDLCSMIKVFNNESIDALVGSVITTDLKSISKSYTLDIDKDNNIHFMVEKPNYPFNNLRGVGCCIFNKRMIPIIDCTRFGYERKQYEMVDWILSARTNLIDSKIKTYVIPGEEININTVEEYNYAKTILCN